MGHLTDHLNIGAYLEAKQAKRDATVSDALRSPAARRQLQLINWSVAATAVTLLLLCLLLGTGTTRVAAYAVTLVALALSLALSGVAIRGLSRREQAG